MPLRFDESFPAGWVYLAVKMTLFALFSFGVKTTLSIPKDLKEVESFKPSKLQEVKSYFLTHTSDKKELSLRFQVALDLPVGECSSIGEGWIQQDLLQLEKVDLSFLKIKQKKELNELFLKNNVMPQKREHLKEELPELPEIQEGLSSAALHWVHEISKKSGAAISPLLPQQFYNHGLPPVRNEWADFDFRSVFSHPFGSAWVRNFYVAYPEDWRELKILDQIELNAKLREPLLLFPKTESDVLYLSPDNLKWFLTVFKEDKNQLREFPLSVRRMLAERTEKELNLDVTPFFKKGESRVPTLIGKVTENITGKRVVAFSLLLMFILPGAIGAMNKLFFNGEGTCEPIDENCPCVTPLKERALECMGSYVCTKTAFKETLQMFHPDKAAKNNITAECASFITRETYDLWSALKPKLVR